jgi:NAD(P)-dependent dehydrogenase (short-subunit alcohol dehydrogenase family)
MHEPKIALVTGAGAGIGRAVATRLAVDGFDLALLDRDREALGVTESLVRALGRTAVPVVADVGSSDDVQAAVSKSLAAFGHLDVLVNNAGILSTGAFLDFTFQQWNDCLGVNLNGTFNCCKAVLPSMVANRRGAIVNMASWTGKRGVANHCAYGASKAAILNLTQCLAEEFGHHGIRINAVCPGIIVETGMRDEAERLNRAQGLPSVDERSARLPLRRPGYPREIADAVAFLVSEAAAYITGESLNVSGGLWMD